MPSHASGPQLTNTECSFDVDRKGWGDRGEGLSVKIKLIKYRRPHLPEIQHIMMQIKQG
jgi:hypothetical protein